MQYYPPLCVTPNGAQTFPCNPFPVAHPSFSYPRIIGEGTVASVALPDGSTQLYFVPTAPAPPAGCCPYPPYVNVPNNPPLNNSTEVWIIRSIPNQFPACQPVVNQQYQKVSSPFWVQSNTDCYGNNPGYQLKFHNDNWTSTTDIQYFCSPLRSHNCFPKQCAGTQTEQPPCEPITVSSHCSKKKCACYKRDESKKRHGVVIDDKSSCSSCMSVEVEKPSASPTNQKKRNKTWFSRKIQKSEMPSITCECDLRPASQKSDKAIATFAEKTVGCCTENGRETQTTCGPSTPIRKVGSFFRVNDFITEMWYPKTPQSQKSMDCDCRDGCSASGGFTSDDGASTSYGTSRNENDSGC